MGWWIFGKNKTEAEKQAEEDAKKLKQQLADQHKARAQLEAEVLTWGQYCTAVLNSRSYNLYLFLFDMGKVALAGGTQVILYYYVSPLLSASLVYRLAPPLINALIVYLGSTIEKCCTHPIPTKEELRETITDLNETLLGQDAESDKKCNCEGGCKHCVGFALEVPIPTAGGFFAATLNPLLGAGVTSFSSVATARVSMLWANRKKMPLQLKQFKSTQGESAPVTPAADFRALEAGENGGDQDHGFVREGCDANSINSPNGGRQSAEQTPKLGTLGVQRSKGVLIRKNTLDSTEEGEALTPYTERDRYEDKKRTQSTMVEVGSVTPSPNPNPELQKISSDKSKPADKQSSMTPESPNYHRRIQSFNPTDVAKFVASSAKKQGQPAGDQNKSAAKKAQSLAIPIAAKKPNESQKDQRPQNRK